MDDIRIIGAEFSNHKGLTISLSTLTDGLSGHGWHAALSPCSVEYLQSRFRQNPFLDQVVDQLAGPLLASLHSRNILPQARITSLTVPFGIMPVATTRPCPQRQEGHWQNNTNQ